MTAWLLTWFWQGTAIVAAVSLTLHRLPRVNAATRYVIWWAVLCAIMWLGWETSSNLPSHVVAGQLSASTAPNPGPTFIVAVRPLPDWLLTLMVAVWLTIALFKLARILGGVRTLYALKDSCSDFPVEIERQLSVWLASHSRTRRTARLLVSDKLRDAAMLGLFDPSIAISSSMLKALHRDDLERVILHEYGHAERRDDWTCLLQALITSALWIHPAIFLIGRELNLEREVACDDWVVARTGAPRAYARCLSRIAESRSRRTTHTVAPALFGRQRNLVRRVERLLDSNRSMAHKPSVLVAGCAFCVLAVFAAELSALPIVTETIDQIENLEAMAMKDIAPPRPNARVTNEIAATSTITTVVDIPSAMAHVRSNLAPDPSADAQLETPAKDEATNLSQTPERTDPVFSSVEASRTLQGRYLTLSDQPEKTAAPWQVIGNAGAGLGASAQRAGVGVAGSFTRAGASIARSF